MKDGIKICPHCSGIMDKYGEYLYICNNCEPPDMVEGINERYGFIDFVRPFADFGPMCRHTVGPPEIDKDVSPGPFANSFLLDNDDETKYIKWGVSEIVFPSGGEIDENDELFDKDRI